MRQGNAQHLETTRRQIQVGCPHNSWRSLITSHIMLSSHRLGTQAVARQDVRVPPAPGKAPPESWIPSVAMLARRESRGRWTWSWAQGRSCRRSMCTVRLLHNPRSRMSCRRVVTASMAPRARTLRKSTYRVGLPSRPLDRMHEDAARQ